MRVQRIMAAVAVLLVSYGVCGVCCHNGRLAMAEDDQGELFIPQADSQSSDSSDYWAGRRSTSPDAAERSVARAYAVQRRPVAARNLDQRSPEEKSTAVAKLIRKTLPWVAGLLAMGGLTMAVFGFVTQRRPKAGFLVRATPSVCNMEAGWVGRTPSQSVLALRMAQTDPPEPHHPFVDANFEEREEEARLLPLRRAA